MHKLLLLTLLIVAACTPTDTTLPTQAVLPDGNTAGSSVPTPTREGASEAVVGDAGSGFGFENSADAPFYATISGAIDAQIGGEGYIACENGRYTVRTSPQGLEQVTLILPPQPATGTYNLRDNSSDTASVSATVSFDDGAVYAGNIDGILILDTVATANGEGISGTFDFSASNGAGSIMVRGELDFSATADATFC